MEIKDEYIDNLKLQHYKEEGTTVKYSVFDQYHMPFYTLCTYIYKNENKAVDATILKESLLATLTYYPDFTGTLRCNKDELLLEHNNRGVTFITATANFSFKDIENVDFDMLQLGVKLYPESSTLNMREDPLLRVNVITLHDKSMILLINTHHAICDAHSMCWFMSAWSNMTKYGNIGPYKHKRYLLQGDTRSSIYSHREIIIDSGVLSKSINYINTNVNVTKEFIFKRKCLEAIKTDLMTRKKNNAIDYISCLDIISAVMWRAVVKAKGLKEDEKVTFGTIVDSRKHLNLTDEYFGNCGFFATQLLLVKSLLEMDLVEVACKIRESIQSVTKEYITSCLNLMESALDRRQTISGINIATNGFLISSFEKFAFYDVDFGMEKAKKFSVPSVYSLMLVLPIATNDGFMARLELKEKEIISVLQNGEVNMILGKQEKDASHSEHFT